LPSFTTRNGTILGKIAIFTAKEYSVAQQNGNGSSRHVVYSIRAKPIGRWRTALDALARLDSSRIEFDKPTLRQLESHQY
jgi:hypothetical protein